MISTLGMSITHLYFQSPIANTFAASSSDTQPPLTLDGMTCPRCEAIEEAIEEMVVWCKLHVIDQPVRTRHTEHQVEIQNLRPSDMQHRDAPLVPKSL